MYKIENTEGVVIGYVDEPRYITVSKIGTFITCPREKANGIAYKSEPYHLFGTPELENSKGEVIVIETNSGEMMDTIFELTSQIVALQEREIEREIEGALDGLKI